MKHVCACQCKCIVHLHLCKWANTSALCISMLFDHPAHPVRPCVCLCVVCLSWNFYIRKVCVTPTQSVDASVCGLPVIVEALWPTCMHSVMLCLFFCEVNLRKQESPHTQSPVLGWNPLKKWWWWCNAVDAVGVLCSIHMQHQGQSPQIYTVSHVRTFECQNF